MTEIVVPGSSIAGDGAVDDRHHGLQLDAEHDARCLIGAESGRVDVRATRCRRRSGDVLRVAAVGCGEAGRPEHGERDRRGAFRGGVAGSVIVGAGGSGGRPNRA